MKKHGPCRLTVTFGRGVAAVRRRRVKDMARSRPTFDSLVTVLVEDSAEVHLAQDTWRERTGVTTLCGQPIRDVATDENFSRDGCMPCANCAVSAGISSVRQTPQVAVNLRRFIERHESAEAQSITSPLAGSGGSG